MITISVKETYFSKEKLLEGKNLIFFNSFVEDKKKFHYEKKIKISLRDYVRNLLVRKFNLTI